MEKMQQLGKTTSHHYFRHRLVRRIACSGFFIFTLASRLVAQPDSLIFTYSLLNAAQFPKIISEVRVWTTDYFPVENLDERNFRVFENDVPQSPITVEGFGSDSGGVSVVLVMDISGSMEEEIRDAQDAAITFVNLLGEFDQAAFVTFYGQVDVVQGFSKDKQKLIDAINSVVLGDGTSVYDAAVIATDLALSVNGKRAIVLLSDGRDNSSVNSFAQTIQKVSTSEIPIFAIGLGLKQNKGAPELRSIAESSGGIFYETPTSSQLEEIYRHIAFLITSYFYRITYRSNNCAEDGTVRHVRIELNRDGFVTSELRQYTAPGHVVALATRGSARPTPGADYSLKIEVPQTGPPLFNVKQVRLRLTYSTPFLNVKSPIDQNIIPGPAFGAPGEFTFDRTVDAAARSIEISLRRKDGQGTANGQGTLAEIIFTLAREAPDSTKLEFTIELLEAKNPSGCDLAMPTDNLTTYSDGMIVWPGDTNHNGRVELTDVLALGIYWRLSGPPRFDSTDQLAWLPHLARKFSILMATHADADGNGAVTEQDLIPIGLNWQKSTTSVQSPKAQAQVAEMPTGRIVPLLAPGAAPSTWLLQLHYEPTSPAPLAGLTFHLRLPANEIVLLNARPGGAWESQPLWFRSPPAGGNEDAVALMQPAGAPLVRHGGILAELELHSRRPLTAPDLLLEKVLLVGADGRTAPATYGEQGGQNIAGTFAALPAYPNPFNPSTRLQISVPQTADITAAIFNTSGQLVRLFATAGVHPGTHSWDWDGRDAAGLRVGSGIYLIRFAAKMADGSRHEIRQKVTLVK